MKRSMISYCIHFAALRVGRTPSGTAGTLLWKISEDTLTITGTGPMPNYNDGELPPWFEFRKEVKNVVIANGVTSIGNFAFAEFEEMISLIMPDTVTIIGEGAFIGCGLSDVVLPNSIKTIGGGAFFGSAISSVIIPISVTQIRDNTFYGCKNLMFVSIPNGVTTIGEAAFEKCKELIAIEIPDSVTQIGIEAFKDSGLIMVVIPNSVKTIGISAFECCQNLISVSLPEGLTEISDRVFWGCVNLNRIKAFTFNGLKKAVIPNYVTTIYCAAFNNCKFSSVFVPSSHNGVSNNFYRPF